MRALRIVAAAVAAAALSQTALAQDFPTRPITIVVPFVAGGSTEISARIVAQQLEARLGKPVIVENRPGAGTVIGSNYVAKAAPDGYTLLQATSTPMAINVTVHKALPYDPATDLIPLAMVAQSPFILIVNPALPVNSVKELIAYGKANPGKLSYGSGGPGAPHHLYAGAVRQHDRHQDVPCAVQGKLARAQRCGRRTHPAHVLRRAAFGRNDPVRQGARARRLAEETARGVARHPDRR